MSQRIPAPLPRDPVLWLMLAAVGAMLTLLSLARYWGFNAGMLDLGNMHQAISSVLRGQPLVTTGPYGNFSRIGGHVELIYLAFVPLVAIWPNPQPMLIGQALLAVAGAIPAYRLAERRLESRLAARCIALIYLCYPVMQTAVLFDFHGDTLGMPLILFALDAADRRAWRWYALWVALALMSKVYVAAPMAGIGAYLWLWGGERRAGTWTMVAAVAYGAIVFFGVRELFTAPDPTRSAVEHYVNHYFGALDELVATFGQRLLNAMIVFGPALFLAWRGWRWLLPAAPLTAAVLISTGPGGVYHYAYHHYALVVPFIVMATLDGAERLRRAANLAEPSRRGQRWKPDLVFVTVIVLATWIMLVDQPLNPRFWQAPPGSGRDHAAYGQLPRDRVAERFLAEHVPPSGPLAASVFLAPRLSNRETLYVVRYPDDSGGERLPALISQVDHIVADALFGWRAQAGTGVIPWVTYERTELGLILRDPAFSVVALRDGLIVFRRDAPPEAQLPQQIRAEALPNPAPTPIAALGPVNLLAATLTPLDGRRVQADFIWQPGPDLPSDRVLVPVSSLDGVADTRFVHLPSYALLPTTAWESGQQIRESFVIEVPADLPVGTYQWRVGWYDPAHPEAYRTDEQSLLGSSIIVGSLTIAP